MPPEEKKAARAGNHDDIPIYAKADGSRMGVAVQSSAPDSSKVNFWVDTSAGEPVLRYWNGSEWKNSHQGHLHEQFDPQSVWEVEHNLGRFPAVVGVDSSGNRVTGKVVFLDLNNLKVIHSAPFAGKLSCI